MRNNKERLFEVFSKLNPIIKESYLNTEEEVDELIYTTDREIKDHLKRNRGEFNNGVPNEIEIRSIEYGDFKLKLNRTNGLKFERAIRNQQQYSANYVTEINEIPIEVKIPITVDVQQGTNGNLIEFRNALWSDHENMTIEIKE